MQSPPGIRCSERRPEQLLGRSFAHDAVACLTFLLAERAINRDVAHLHESALSSLPLLRVLAKEEGEEVTLSADREHAPTTMLRKLWLRASRLLSS